VTDNPHRSTVVIQNVKGLHARASAKLVETAERFDAQATISKDGQASDADSIMGLLMLAASKGTTIEVETRGPEADMLLSALVELIEGKFGEDA